MTFHQAGKDGTIINITDVDLKDFAIVYGTTADGLVTQPLPIYNGKIVDQRAGQDASRAAAPTIRSGPERRSTDNNYGYGLVLVISLPHGSKSSATISKASN